MHISEFFGLPKGHINFDFIDATISHDTELFIDPCLIEVTNNNFCQEAMKTMNDYFDAFYSLYRNSDTEQEKIKILSHATEINATKLGYGNGDNGHGNTYTGLIEIFKSLEKFDFMKIPFVKAIDLPIFITDFAEDGLSDMLTNILFYHLSKFTIEQCEKYSFETKDIKTIHYYWNETLHKWDIYMDKALYLEGKLLLLVPKNIVRHNFYYDTEQYFRSMILTKIQQEQTTYDNEGKSHSPTKKLLRNQLVDVNSDVKEIVVGKTKDNPDLLNDYHDKMKYSYKNKGMSDDELDFFVYNY